jgi:DNA-binding response OmpR family regulator
MEQITFGPFRLDRQRRILRGDGIATELGQRACDVLCTLVAAKGAVVSKDVLMAGAWPGQIVEENTLQAQISLLRKALGEAGPRSIITVPGRGYRLVGDGAAAEETAAPVMPDVVRVIVVDDEPDLREMIATYLSKYGFIVEAAGDGRELDAHLADDPADLLILDVNMPGEDGFAIARRVRAHSTMPILMLTADGDTVDRVAGLEVGADDYMTKPFDLRELRARIQAILRRTGRAREARSHGV